jgi:predicted metal-dependent phosphoesterase TrpH
MKIVSGPRIDLHTHSTRSDGTDTPTELVRAATAAGLDVLALTDHDTTVGWAEAAAALPPGMSLVPGAEFSCVYPLGGRSVSVHLLGYLFDPHAAAIVAEQERLRLERRGRLRAMAERMAADGLPVDPDVVLGGLGEDAPAGRPHLARMLVAEGVVNSVDEAFERYLSSRHGYYIPRADTPVGEAIDMVADAGGCSVLAHPFARSRGPSLDAEAIRGLAARGLTGIEVDHPDHDRAARGELAELAGELDLVRTGSSDYHGSNKPNRLGEETTAPATLDALAERATGATIVAGTSA